MPVDKKSKIIFRVSAKIDNDTINWNSDEFQIDLQQGHFEIPDSDSFQIPLVVTVGRKRLTDQKVVDTAVAIREKLNSQLNNNMGKRNNLIEYSVKPPEAVQPPIENEDPPILPTQSTSTNRTLLKPRKICNNSYETKAIDRNTMGDETDATSHTNMIQNLAETNLLRTGRLSLSEQLAKKTHSKTTVVSGLTHIFDSKSKPKESDTGEKTHEKKKIILKEKPSRTDLKSMFLDPTQEDFNDIRNQRQIVYRIPTHQEVGNRTAAVRTQICYKFDHTPPSESTILASTHSSPRDQSDASSRDDHQSHNNLGQSASENSERQGNQNKYTNSRRMQPDNTNHNQYRAPHDKPLVDNLPNKPNSSQTSNDEKIRSNRHNLQSPRSDVDFPMNTKHRKDEENAKKDIGKRTTKDIKSDRNKYEKKFRVMKDLLETMKTKLNDLDDGSPNGSNHYQVPTDKTSKTDSHSHPHPQLKTRSLSSDELNLIRKHSTEKSLNHQKDDNVECPYVKYLVDHEDDTGTTVDMPVSVFLKKYHEMKEDEPSESEKATPIVSFHNPNGLGKHRTHSSPSQISQEIAKIPHMGGSESESNIVPLTSSQESKLFSHPSVSKEEDVHKSNERYQKNIEHFMNYKKGSADDPEDKKSKSARSQMLPDPVWHRE